MADRPVRTRIAPSPTGDPHVGTGYMGLVNMVFAKQHQGQFVLRIDDTDRARYREGSEQAIFDALRWLGIEWDEGPDKGGAHGPYRQSERSELYRRHAEMLIERGTAYRCFCTKERLDALRAAQRERKETPGYDGHCRDLSQGDVARHLGAGTPCVVRLRLPAGEETTFQDMLRGPITWKHADLQDQVLLKADGFPTYHLASVVDDHLMGITHIIRAEEWISSGPLHKVLFEAFGWEMPAICHMPLLRNADKSKISKRKNPTSLLYYRDAGFLPEAMLNFLGLMGWGGPKREDGTNEEIFSVLDMMAHFRLEDIRLGGPVFDQDKLRHVNASHLRALDLEGYFHRVRDFLFDDARLRQVCALMQPRAHTLGELVAKGACFFGDVSHVSPETREKKNPAEWEPVAGLVPKKADRDATWFALAHAQEALERVSPWKADALEAAGRDLATDAETGWKARDLFMTLRVAVTGSAESPPLFETMEVLGRSRCMGRLTDALRVLGAPGKKAMKRLEKERDERRRQAGKAGSAPDGEDAQVG